MDGKKRVINTSKQALDLGISMIHQELHPIRFRPVMENTSRITGVVVSAEDNEPIVGASVLVKGTTLGTITDMNGRILVHRGV